MGKTRASHNTSVERYRYLGRNKNISQTNGLCKCEVNCQRIQSSVKEGVQCKRTRNVVTN
jgi:hypothetical protein